MDQYGKVRVYIGPMYAGKTDSLVRVARERVRARQFGRIIPFEFIKPSFDTRDDDPRRIITHDEQGLQIEALVIPHDNPMRILEEPTVIAAQVVLIDEGQFFDAAIRRVVQRLFMDRKEVYFAGLDTDHLGRPFPATDGVAMLPFAKVFKLKSTCAYCGGEARFSIRLIDGRPAPVDSPQFMVQGKGAAYKPACPVCFMTELGKVGINPF